MATNGAYGLELARTRLPDIILFDLMMPDMSGEEVAAELRETDKTAGIPRIFLTALVTREDTGGSVLKKSGKSCFIAKPVRTKTLISAINGVMREA